MIWLWVKNTGCPKNPIGKRKIVPQKPGVPRGFLFDPKPLGDFGLVFNVTRWLFRFGMTSLRNYAAKVNDSIQCTKRLQKEEAGPLDLKGWNRLLCTFAASIACCFLTLLLPFRETLNWCIKMSPSQLKQLGKCAGSWPNPREDDGLLAGAGQSVQRWLDSTSRWGWWWWLAGAAWAKLHTSSWVLDGLQGSYIIYHDLCDFGGSYHQQPQGDRSQKEI